MEELSIEEKAKAYDEAIERAKEKYAMFEGMQPGDVLEDVFPELKESEDEKVMKDIRVVLESSATKFFKEEGKMPIWYDRAIAWLEKQSEQKPQGKSALEAIKEEKIDNANKVEQKSAWSEEDEEMLDKVIKRLHKYSVSNEEYLDKYYWLKEIKHRVQPKQEWSEEDECCINQLIVFCENCMVQDSNTKKCADWLKSLKERYTWEPSDEQLKAQKGEEA